MAKRPIGIFEFNLNKPTSEIAASLFAAIKKDFEEYEFRRRQQSRPTRIKA